MAAPAFLYKLYERRLMRELGATALPRHIGVMLDGNRRWAKAQGLSAQEGLQVVTLWLLSTDNLKRSAEEIGQLAEIIAGAVETLAASGYWRLRMVGNLDMLPESLSRRLRAAEAATAKAGGVEVNIAVGYGGRQEIADAVRSLLREEAACGRSLEDVAQSISVDGIARHLYTKGQPDPDLVIRTSGEQRMSGFMLWQTVHTELYFCEAYWPDFRRTDFLRALRDYTQRERRLGR